eukprot:scaffold15300_cov18-Tisochrysis_lutea.AAC.2
MPLGLDIDGYAMPQLGPSQLESQKYHYALRKVEGPHTEERLTQLVIFVHSQLEEAFIPGTLPSITVGVDVTSDLTWLVHKAGWAECFTLQCESFCVHSPWTTPPPSMDLQEEEQRAWMATQHEDEEKQRAQWQQEITYKQQLQVTQEDKAVFQ